MKKFILIAVMCCGILLTACGGQENMTGQEDMEFETDGYYSCPTQELNAHLTEREADFPYLWAHISIDGYSAKSWPDIQVVDLEGEASVTWQSCESLAQLEDELSQWTKDGTEDSLELICYSFPLPDDIHALDIYRALEEMFGAEDLRLKADCGGENGSSYYLFTWYSPYLDSEGWYYQDFNRAPVNLYIKDGLVHGLAVKGGAEVYTIEELTPLFKEYERAIGCRYSNRWSLSEEDLYWIDHEQRITEMEDPKRRFVEIRALKAFSDHMPEAYRYLGIIKEADYEVPLTEDGPMIRIHLVLPENPDGEEYICPENDCRRAIYNMTVTNMESDSILQESAAKYLCIKLPDTVFLKDYDGDGYVDMRIDRSEHLITELAMLEVDNYMLWNPLEGGFEHKTGEEVRNRYRAVQNGLTEEEQREKTQREKVSPFTPLRDLPEGADRNNYIELTMDCGDFDYVVQPGDSLWEISRRFLGEGSHWSELERTGSAAESPDLLSAGEIIHIPGELGARETIYIRKDSRYKSSTISVREHPSGFSYRYIATDKVDYYKWDDMNVIYCLTTYNEVGENALSEEWEDFQAEVIRCSEEICPGRVSNLQFEKYFVRGGCDLYGYSFEYDAGGRTMEYTAFIRLDSSIALEVICIREKEPNTVMIDTVRYIAAGFVDLGGYPEMGSPGSLGDNVGADDWAYPWLHNLFTAAKQQFG